MDICQTRGVTLSIPRFIFLVISSAAANAAAGLSLKQAALATGTLSNFHSPRILSSLVGSVFAYALAFILYFLALRSAPVAVTYISIVSATTIILLFVDIFIFKEAQIFSAASIAGVLFLLCGVFFLTIGLG
jgi:multidrug transporter EmrE-like cation transporter